ncbi:MAG: adenylate/guanylate cyclase domain-containing protein [Candidatus Sericytochromatia bacterium]
MFLLINTKTKEKILLDKEIYIGNFTNSDIKIQFPSDIMSYLSPINNSFQILKKVGNLVINNKPVLSKILEDGDQINIGYERYLFLIEESAEKYNTNVLAPYLFIEGNEEQDAFIKSLISINTFSQKISLVLDYITLLNAITELSISILNVEKGFLLLCETNSNTYTVKSAINLERELENKEKFEETICNKILSSFKSEKVLIIDKPSSIDFKFINSIMVGVLKARDNTIGYLCLINKDKKLGDFNERDKYILQTLCTQSAICIDNANLYEKVKNESDLRNNLQRYLPRNTVSKILDSKINLSLVGELQDCSILFADICGFTSISENISPQETVKLLNEYLTNMTKVIFSFNGSVDKFIGDGIMAVFGAPVSNPNHSLEATLAAVEMKNEIENLKKKFIEDFGIKDFNIRIAINSGQAIYGNVGSPQRMDFTVIGDSVNIASRMEKIAPEGGILISKSTYDKVREYINVKEWEPINIKGKKEAVKVYEVIELEKVSTDNKENTVRMFARVQAKTFVSIMRGTFRTNGLIKDISLGGLSIGTVGNYNPDEIILMTFKLSNNATFRNIRGIVKHVEKSMFEAITMGVEFIDFPKDKAKELIEYIESEINKR